MAAAKDCHALTSYYEKCYKEKYLHSPNINRWQARWMFDAVLGSMTAKQAKELIEYYFTTASAKGHDLDWFAYNYEKLVRSKQDAEEDRKHRKKLMEESRRRAEEWRKSGKSSLAGD